MKIIKIIFIFIFSLKTIYANEYWKKYPYHQKNSKIYFPQDEGRHDSFPNLEWWYTVIHAKGEITKDRYAILVTHFNNRFRFFTVANLDRKTHLSATALGKLEAKRGYLDLKHTTKYGTDIFRNRKGINGRLIPFEYEIKTHHSRMNIDLNLRSLKKPLMVGETGYTSIGSSGNSYYYSLTRLDVHGELTIDGFSEKINGLAWMDHQWGPFIVSPIQLGKVFESYEWFCLQLDDGSDIMISNIYNRKFEIPMDKAYGRVEYIDKNGNSKSIIKRNFQRIRYWQDPVSGHYMSMGWSLDIPEWNLNLLLEPEFADQMVRFPLGGDFWEGSIKVRGTIAQKNLTGKGFGELIHRFEPPFLKITSIKLDKINKSLKLDWKVKNPDEGNPLKFSISLISNNREILIVKSLKETSAQISYKELNPLDSFRVKVEASSIDGVLNGNDISKKLKL